MEEAVGIIGNYREFVKARGKLIIITPQEAGFRHYPSHVSFTDFGAISRICARVGADIDRRFSFPFPRPAGRVFAYNEFSSRPISGATSPDRRTGCCIAR